MYWDTSAILKIYVAEPDSEYFLTLLARADQVVATSSVTSIEVLCALFRKEQGGDLNPGAAQHVFDRYIRDTERGRIIEIPYGQAVIREANALASRLARRRKPPIIRSLDAIHLASALAGRMKTLVATDRRLRECACLARLKILP